MTGSDRPEGAPPTVFLIAGEESGDILGASLMASVSARLGGRVRFAGVGGSRMTRLGLTSLFPMEDLTVHGLAEALARGRRLLARVRQASAAVVEANPAVLILVDVPGFNLRVARRVRRQSAAIPIVDYVSPTVWAYFPGRARRMARFVDQLLAVLPFEPEVHRRLGGPPTTYVGHPLIERFGELRPGPGEREPLAPGRPPVLLVLPGSRRKEVERLMGRFGETVALIVRHFGPVEVVLPAVPELADDIRARAASWPVRPTIVVGQDAARAAFRRANAALAASGTVTLELALAGVPMVVAYRVDPFLRAFKFMMRAHSIVLPNLIVGSNAVPEFLDSHANPERLAAALIPLLSDTPQRAAQLAAFAGVEEALMLPGSTPSARAADIVLAAMRR